LAALDANDLLAVHRLCTAHVVWRVDH
jgi:hypothetical protein